MKKRFLSLALAIVLITGMLPVIVQAAASVTISGHVAGNLRTEIDDYRSIHAIADYSDIDSLTVIGGTVNNADRKFLYSSNLYSFLKTVDLSRTNIDYTGAIDGGHFAADNPNEIPGYAFGNWNAMTTIALPDSVTAIKEFALNCTSLETVYLPASLASVNAAIFGRYHYSVRDVYTDSTTPPAALHPNAFMEVAAGAAIHVPDGSQSNWDAADFAPDNKKCTDYLLIEDMVPVITYSKERTSETTAKITLISDEPGYAYYRVVKDGAEEPSIDTSGAGEAFTGYSNTLEIELTGLEPDPYDIYVKAKDLRGHESELLKIDLEWYVAFVNAVIKDHEAGKLGDEISEYLDTLGIPGAFEKIQSLEISGGSLNDEDWEFFYNTYQIAYSTQSVDLSGTISQTIPDETFKYYELTEIYLPAGIESIGEQAFKDCSNLAHMTISASMPPSVGNEAFEGIPSGAAVHVPFGSADLYRGAGDGDTSDNLWYGMAIDEQAETTLPQVISVTPVGTGVSRNGSMIITFSEPMDTAVAGTVYLSADGGLTCSFTLQGKSWTVSDAVYTALYSGLAFSKEYTTVISGFRDKAGNLMLTDSSHSFTTAARSGSDGDNGSSGSGKGSSGGKGGSTAAGSTGAGNNSILPGDAGSSPANPFEDIDMKSWYYDSIMYVYKKGLMTGISPNRFNPAGSITRGMLVTVLYRLEGITGRYTNNFSDIVPGSWYEQAASWAAANCIVKGVGNNCFAPENKLNREQLAVMLYNYAVFKGKKVTGSGSKLLYGYEDAGSISKWAEEAMEWAVNAGIISGDGTALNPKGLVSRAETAAMLQRFIENVMGK